MGALAVTILPQLPSAELEKFLTDAPKFKPLLRDYVTKKKGTGLESRSLLQVLDKLDPRDPVQQEASQ